MGWRRGARGARRSRFAIFCAESCRCTGELRSYDSKEHFVPGEQVEVILRRYLVTNSDWKTFSWLALRRRLMLWFFGVSHTLQIFEYRSYRERSQPIYFFAITKKCISCHTRYLVQNTH